jgi:hypothetical protein
VRPRVAWHLPAIARTLGLLNRASGRGRMRAKREESSNPGPDLTAKERAGMEGALNRCSELTRQIEAQLMTKKMEEIRDVMA